MNTETNAETNAETDVDDAERSPALFPYADRIKPVTLDDPWQWLARGWHDFRVAGWVSMMMGAVYVVLGYAVSVMLVQIDMAYLMGPAAAGFLMISPALAVGFYALSRAIERGERPTARVALLAWRENPSRLLGAGLAFVFFMIIWLRLAALIYAIAFPHTSLDLQALANQTFFTQDGLVFFGVGTIVGAGMAFAVFLLSAVSPQMLLDQRADFVPSILISTFSVLYNFRPMMLWGAIILVVTTAGLATAFVGLVVTLPLIGHASWHAYRALVTAEAPSYCRPSRLD